VQQPPWDSGYYQLDGPLIRKTCESPILQIDKGKKPIFNGVVHRKSTLSITCGVEAPKTDHFRDLCTKFGDV
jgi:hypothetical protein